MAKRKATKATTPVSKKAKSSPAKTKKSKASNASKAQVSVDDAAVMPYPSAGWKVVLSGAFTLFKKSELKKKLESRNVTITTSVTKKTTHLILGTEDSTTKRGIGGRGSANHIKAQDIGTPIITEQEVWDLINDNDADIAATADNDNGNENLLVEEEVLDSGEGEHDE